MRSPSIEFYLSDHEFECDRSDEKIKSELRERLSLAKAKINFLKTTCKRIQFYSVSRVSDEAKRRQILLYKKVLVEGIKAQIVYFYDHLGSGEFMKGTYFNVHELVVVNNHLRYLESVCTNQVNMWLKDTVEEASLLNNFRQDMDKFQWVLRRNWDTEKHRMFEHVKTHTKEFLQLMR